MTGRPSLEERLDQLGSASGPRVDPAFADHLDARLRVAHVEQSGGRHRRSMKIPIAATAVAVLVFGLAGLALRSRSDSSEVVMTVATDTEVYFDGGASTVGSPGLVLPDGARIVVGVEGQAVVDGVVLGAGTRAIVVGDRLDVSTPRPSTDPPSTSVTSTSVATTDPVRSTDPLTDRSSTSSPVTSSPVTSRPPTSSTTGSDRSTTVERSTTTAPPTTERRSTTQRPSTTATSPTTDAPPADRTTVSAPGSEPVTLRVTRSGEQRIRLDWTVERGADSAGWRVRAARGDRVETVVLIRGSEARSATLERGPLAGTTIWVEGLDRSGQPMVISNSITIG